MPKKVDTRDEVLARVQSVQDVVKKHKEELQQVDYEAINALPLVNKEIINKSLQAIQPLDVYNKLVKGVDRKVGEGNLSEIFPAVGTKETDTIREKSLKTTLSQALRIKSSYSNIAYQLGKHYSYSG